MPIIGVLATGGLAPLAPTIGTATGGNTSASITFTAPTWVGKGSGTVTYTATSSPSGITGTSTSSPVTVSGLSNGTAYTFTVKATTSYGVTGPASASSNSVTPANPYVAAWDWIATATTVNSPTLTFSSLPADYATFKIIGNPYGSGDSIGNTTWNGNTSSYYENGNYGGTGGLASFAGTPAINASQVRRFAVNSASTNPVWITYFNANSTVAGKQVQAVSAYSDADMSFTWLYGAHASTSRISSVTLATGNSNTGAGNWASPTVFSIYGMKEGTAI